MNTRVETLDPLPERSSSTLAPVLVSSPSPRPLPISPKVPRGASVAFGHIGGSFFEKLANLTWPTLVVPLQRVRVAALLAQLNSPIDRVFDGKAGLLRESDLTKLASKGMLESAQLAERMMEDGRSLCIELGIDSRAKLQLTCENDMRLVLHLLRKGKNSRESKEYTSLDEAGQEFINELAKIKGVPVDNPWIALRRARNKQEPQVIAGLGNLIPRTSA